MNFKLVILYFVLFFSKFHKLFKYTNINYAYCTKKTFSIKVSLFLFIAYTSLNNY